MFGFPILEVAIGLCFVYLLLSLICTTVNETIVALTRRRGKMLAQGIATLLGDADIKDKVYAHPLIKSLTQGNGLPSYISSDEFALALMDIVTGQGNRADDSKALQEGKGLDVFQDKATHLREVLGAIMADQRSALGTTQKKIANWYTQSMDRLSGAYKRRTTLWIWGLAIAVTLLTNANTIRVTQILWSNQAVRSAVVNAAQARAQQGEPMPLVDYSDPNNPEASKPVRVEDNALTRDENKLLGQLMGWGTGDWSQMSETGPLIWWGTHLLGWLFTVIALSLGAPFWFDMLNKFMNLRNAGKASSDQSAPPEETPKAIGKGVGA
jgi:hypothetical protein